MGGVCVLCVSSTQEQRLVGLNVYNYVIAPLGIWA